MTAFKTKSTAELQNIVRAGKRQQAIQEARKSLLAFAKLMMPDPEDEGDATRSIYEVQKHHIVLAEALERVERGEILRLAISMPPQHGKSELGTRLFPAWAIGRNPSRAFLIGCYNQDFANDIGADIREYMEKPTYGLVFPRAKLRDGSRSKEMMKLTLRGQIACVGRKGSGTGKPANIEIIDDPLKNAEEAESPTIRKELHNWYRKVFYSRAQTTTAIIVVHTRWNEDDLIGRLCDPDHPDHDPDLAKMWTYINIPAVLKDDGKEGTRLAAAMGLKLKRPTDPLVIKAFGDMPMTALWEDRFDLKHLASAAIQDPPGFNALYMGRPTPEDGDYFRAEWIDSRAYSEHELPKSLRMYGASDHAVTEDTQNDENVIGCVGIDRDDDIWVLPDLVWERMQTDRIVEELLAQFAHKPQLWWMEDENISKSFGPFLRKRMVETNTYCTIEGVKPTRDKRSRSRSIQGRMSMKKVRLPKFAPWYSAARSQLLKFPYATHDDFVDWLSLIGLGLDREIKAPKEKTEEKVVAVGSIAWIKAAAARERKQSDLKKRIAGW